MHNHPQGKKRVRRFNLGRVLRRYYIVGVIIIAGLCLHEELQNPNSQVGAAARYYLDHPTWNEFMIGNAKPMGHIKDTVPE